jgi:hypothetical protein
MTKTTKGLAGGLVASLILFVLVLSISAVIVHSTPSGGSITFNSTDNGPTVLPDSRNDTRGTITTINLQTVQQDQRWKGYIGNVSGVLTLDDANQFTIYDWELTGTVNGQVYASRNGSLDWSSVSCAPDTLIISESTFFSMTDANADDINSTFNGTDHKAFLVGSNTITADTCSSTATFVNDARQFVDSSALYQEVLITDASGNSLIFMTEIEDDATGYNANTTDFQLIVPEATSGLATSYYFYVELQ